jgi:hypothetical protein
MVWDHDGSGEHIKYKIILQNSRYKMYRVVPTWCLPWLQVGKDPRPVMRAAYEAFQNGSGPEQVRWGCTLLIPVA